MPMLESVKWAEQDGWSSLCLGVTSTAVPGTWGTHPIQKKPAAQVPV